MLVQQLSFRSHNTFQIFVLGITLPNITLERYNAVSYTNSFTRIYNIGRVQNEVAITCKIWVSTRRVKQTSHKRVYKNIIRRLVKVIVSVYNERLYDVYRVIHILSSPARFHSRLNGACFWKNVHGDLKITHSKRVLSLRDN